MTTLDRLCPTAYGCESFGRLRRVLLHRPSRVALQRITAENHDAWLFDAVPDIPRFIDEHDRYRQVLLNLGVEVLELTDYVRENRELADQLPNLVYLHDTAVIARRGAFLSRMAWRARRHEERVVREALTNLGVPILTEFDDPDHAFEGCLLLSPETILVAETERHSSAAVACFISKALDHWPEVLHVQIPRARRYMHPDTIFNRIDHDLALAYLPAFESTRLCTRDGVEPIDFAAHLAARGIDIIPVCDSEQRRLACSFVPLEPGVLIHYDTALDHDTCRALSRRGVELVLFHPDALVAGGGSLRCLTLRLHRSSGCESPRGPA